MSDPVQTIEVFDFTEKSFRVLQGWELHVQGRFAKLATKLWNYCRTKGWIVQSYESRTKVERIRIDAHDLMDRIMQQYEGSLFRDHDPEMVIIGRDTFRKMMGIRELQDYCGGPLSLTATAERWRGGDQRDPTARPVKTMWNIPVRIVSNMEGMVIVDRGR